MRKVPVRSYAHPFDRPVEGDDSVHGVGASPDAIGGYYGIGWYAFFEDHQTGERFRVRCSDGVNGGKGPHSDRDLMWLDQCRQQIQKRIAEEIRVGVREVRLSTIEWNIMLNYIADGWIDPEPGQQYAQVDRTLRKGMIGKSHGVPVVAITERSSNLF